MGDQVLVFTLDGKRYELNLEEITGLDTKAFRVATGTTFRQSITSLTQAGADVDLDTVAGIVWLARRKAGETVDFDSVLGSITYDSDFVVIAGEVDSPEV